MPSLRHLLVLALTLAAVEPGLAQRRDGPSPPQNQAQGPNRPEPQRLPAERTTRHTLEVGGRTLAFQATAGALTLVDGGDRPQAEMGYVAYTLDGADAGTRPVTFAVNGGPGASSAWLHLGMVGPWRLDFSRAIASPSTPPVLEANAEGWLAFTDLVFIDPPGTGFSRILAEGDEARRQIWSVDGDVEVVAAFIRRWLQQNRRVAAPKFLVGESYGGFRGPKVARALQQNHGVALSGLVLVSPVLDFAWRTAERTSPLPWVAELPSMAAAARDAPDRAALADVEAYARGPMLVDLAAGRGDAAAVARLAERVAAFTGLDPALVRRLGGRVDTATFRRERSRDLGLIASAYDATVTGLDPQPDNAFGRAADQILDGLRAPLTSAALALYARLEWLPERRYEVLNGQVSGAWQWGRGFSLASAMPELAAALALDPRLEVVVAHGMTDVVTPYFQSALLIDQLAPTVARDRVRLFAYPGGHMFYDRAEGRRAIRDEAEALVRRATAR